MYIATIHIVRYNGFKIFKTMGGQVNLAGLCDLVNMAERYEVSSLVYVAWIHRCERSGFTPRSPLLPLATTGCHTETWPGPQKVD